MPMVRFSLRWLMIVVAIAAIALVLFSLPLLNAVAVWIATAIFRGVLPSMALVGCIFARGDSRAFSLGVLVASVPVVFGTIGLIAFHTGGVLLAAASQLIYCVVCGAVAVASRRWLVRLGLASDL
jgi:hypothetical protein